MNKNYSSSNTIDQYNDSKIDNSFINSNDDNITYPKDIQGLFKLLGID